ncbi:MAG: DEAD/DEAH box helicase [Mobilicoccus sp.]|nr:DEAD/DEAH box helicase [Mobilicoccus sp.]
MSAFDPAALLASLPGPRVAAVRTLPAREAQVTSWPTWTPPAVREAWQARGISAPYVHQARAAHLLHDGRDCVISTGTASGKSLAYLLPALTAILDRGGLRPATLLYIAPTKALAADQLAHLESLGIEGVRAAALDGDTPPHERGWIARHANVVLTNPDMLHHSILPGHGRLAALLRGLSYVVVDECHAYRGVFGTHVSAVLRRLRRVAAHHGANPTFAFASATVARPAEHATALLGRPVDAVTDDTSPAAERTVALCDTSAPPGEERLSVLTHAGGALAHLVSADVRSLVFTRSRAGAEIVADVARARLADGTPEPSGTQPGAVGGVEPGSLVAAYRGGYLPEERRELERRLRSGDLRGLATTSALELGIDVAGLDAVVLAGWPGTTAAWWQRAGRAGRAGQRSLVLFLAADDPLDAYLVAHPDALFDRALEACVISPDNPHILGPHLLAAAFEVPLRPEETDATFGPGALALVDRLTDAGLLRRRPTGWFWTRDERPTDDLPLRGTGRQVSIVDDLTGRIVGTVDAARSESSVHTGAVHLHQGTTYVVRDLDQEAAVAHVVAGDPGWTTTARSRSAFVILDVAESRATAHHGGIVTTSTGAVSVRSQVTAFLRRLPGGEVLGEHPLDFAERAMTTRAVWWTVPEHLLAAAGVAEEDVPGALHAAEHAAIGLLPLLVAADRWDIGGVSTALHPDTGLPTVMIYDGHPGGAGFTTEGYHRAHEWLTRTRDAVRACRCSHGCPSCIQSPKCGNGNEPLHKAGAIAVLDLLVSVESASGLAAGMEALVTNPGVSEG